MLLYIDRSQSSLPSFEALPPQYQTEREIKAILADPRLKSFLKEGEEVLEVRKERDGYTVLTNQEGQISVRVTYLPGGIGPLRFELEFPS